MMSKVISYLWPEYPGGHWQKKVLPCDTHWPAWHGFGLHGSHVSQYFPVKPTGHWQTKLPPWGIHCPLLHGFGIHGSRFSHLEYILFFELILFIRELDNLRFYFWPEKPGGHWQTNEPPCGEHCPPLRHGLGVQGSRFSQYFPEKPGGHWHIKELLLDDDETYDGELEPYPWLGAGPYAKLGFEAPPIYIPFEPPPPLLLLPLLPYELPLIIELPPFIARVPE